MRHLPNVGAERYRLPIKPSDYAEAVRTVRPSIIRSALPDTSNPFRIGWIMSLPSTGSGGHQNLFRFMEYAEKAGYASTIYFYVTDETVVNEIAMRRMLNESGNYPDLSASMEMFDKDSASLKSMDAIVSSSWETAHASQLVPSDAKRLYFVQDFEPYFYPSGSLQLMAEQTYKYGFTAITAGRWLSHKLSSEYGMQAHSFDFAVDDVKYRLTNSRARKDVFFYARPSTPRRGFELGILALAELKRRKPEVVIHFAGEDIPTEAVPFEFISHGIMPTTELTALYNRCAAALVISTTNFSLLPLELLACGVTPVVNDAPNNTMVSQNEHIRYVEPFPNLLADELQDAIEGSSAQSVTAMSTSARSFTWDDSGAQFVTALQRCVND
jgi:glycosyltransferase involved in cell wall biosynthesis